MIITIRACFVYHRYLTVIIKYTGSITILALITILPLQHTEVIQFEYDLVFGIRTIPEGTCKEKVAINAFSNGEGTDITIRAGSLGGMKSPEPNYIPRTCEFADKKICIIRLIQDIVMPA